METTINIDHYLSEEDKIEIARDEYRRIVRENLLKDYDRYPDKTLKDYERVMSNAVYYYLEQSIDSILGTDSKKLIEQNVKKVFNDRDYTYTVFRNSPFDSKRSLAQTFLDEAITKNRHILEEKVIQGMEKIDTENIMEGINDIIYQVIENKLKK